MKDLKECPRCLFTEDIAKIGEIQCEYCDLQDHLALNSNPIEWEDILAKIKKKGKGKNYDCLIGISGGEDSSILLFSAVATWGLRPLVIHFNNRTNRPEADNNIRVLRDLLSVNFIEYFVDKNEYENLSDSLLRAGVPDADIANDVVMSKLMYKTAKDHGIKYILNGHSFKYEGSSPKKWSLIDHTYLNSVYRFFNGKDLKNYPLYTVWDQIQGAILGVRQIRPFHYVDELIDRAAIIKQMKKFGWQEYGGKHNENIYTAFIGNFVLPKKFGIDKRITYMSAQIRERIITKEQAKEILKNDPVFNLDDLGDRKEHLIHLVNSSPIGSRDLYQKTNYKLLRPIFWVLMNMGIFPKTAYKKYCV